MCPNCGKSTQLPGTIVGCKQHVGVYDKTPPPKGMRCGYEMYDGGHCKKKKYKHRGHCRA